MVERGPPHQPTLKCRHALPSTVLLPPLTRVLSVHRLLDERPLRRELCSTRSRGERLAEQADIPNIVLGYVTRTGETESSMAARASRTMRPSMKTPLCDRLDDKAHGDRSPTLQRPVSWSRRAPEELFPSSSRCRSC